MATGPQQFATNDFGGINLYYVPPADEPPNIFANFWANYLQQRTPYALTVLKARLGEYDQKSQYSALAALARVREDLLAEQAKNERAVFTQTTTADRSNANIALGYYKTDANSANVRAANATRAWVAQLGEEAAQHRAGALDRDGEEILRTYATRKAAAERAMADAADAGDEDGYNAALDDLTRATAVAKDAASTLDPLQYDTLTRGMQRLRPLVEDAGAQEDVGGAVNAQFQEREGVNYVEPKAPREGGGGRRLRQPAPAARRIAERARETPPSPTATESKPSAMVPGASPTTPASPARAAEGAPPDTTTSTATKTTTRTMPENGRIEAELKALDEKEAAIKSAPRLPQGFESFQILPGTGPRTKRTTTATTERTERTPRTIAERLRGGGKRDAKPEKAPEETIAGAAKDYYIGGDTGEYKQVQGSDLPKAYEPPKKATAKPTMSPTERSHSAAAVQSRGAPPPDYGPSADLAPGEKPKHPELEAMIDRSKTKTDEITARARGMIDKYAPTPFHAKAAGETTAAFYRGLQRAGAFEARSAARASDAAQLGFDRMKGMLSIGPEGAETPPEALARGVSRAGDVAKAMVPNMTGARELAARLRGEEPVAQETPEERKKRLEAEAAAQR